MKKLICILLCMFVLLGCSAKEESPNIKNEEKTEIKNENKENTASESDNSSYETYTLYSVIDTDEGSWYYDVPYLNEVKLGKAKTFLNGDKWWLAYAADTTKEINNLDEAFDISIKAYYSGVSDYFIPSDEGFVPEKKEKVKILDFDMYKYEGYVANAKNYEGPSTNCWIYGYSFIIGNTPCAMLGMTYEDDSDQAKKDIVMYVDDMVKSLRAE